jgi:two-component system response regulator HydG
MNQPYLLIVHPDKSSRALLRGMLDGLNYRIAEASAYRMGVGMLGRDPDALVLAGADPGDPEVTGFLSTMKRHQPHVPLILLLSGEAPDLAQQALRYGAASVLRFPSPTTQVRAAVVHALGLVPSGFPQAARSLPQQLPIPASAPPQPLEAALVGDDYRLRQALELARTSAATRCPILVVGESGTGKSLLARIIHELSPRRNGPFVELGCQSRDKEFDGLDRVPQAHGGTLVLDEVNALNPTQQLRVHMLLTDGRQDSRLILTSRNDGVADGVPGRFWHYLYAQNSCATLRLPALRDRESDILRLAEHFLARSARELGRGGLTFAPEALSVLSHHHWPGNVAELKSTIRKAVSNCHGPRIDPIHLGLTTGAEAVKALKRRWTAPASAAGQGQAANVRIRPLREALAEPEKWLILRALQARDWNRQETADALVINRATLDKKMKKYGLGSGEGRPPADPPADT